METNDIILNTDGSLIEDNGDFRTGDNANNLIFYNVVSHLGHFRTAPLLGGQLDLFLNADILPTVIERTLRSTLANDIFPNAEVDAKDFPTIVINKEIVISASGDN